MANRIAVIGARRRRRGGVSSPAPADLTSLIASIGGNSVVVAAYDVRSGVTQSANLVSQWDDARGASGYGPPFTAAGAARPTYSAGALTITGDGTNTIMATASSALFDLAGQFALYYVGTVPANASGGGQFVVACNDNGAFARYFQIASLAASAGIGSVANAGSTAGATAAGATRRIVAASKDATTIYCEVPNQAPVSLASTTPSGNNNLWLFGDRGSNIGTYAAAVVRAVLVLNRKNAGDVTAIRDWAITNHSAVAA